MEYQTARPASGRGCIDFGQGTTHWHAGPAGAAGATVTAAYWQWGRVVDVPVVEPQ